MNAEIPNPDEQLAAQQQMQDAERPRHGSEKSGEDILRQMHRIGSAIAGKAKEGFNPGPEHDHLKVADPVGDSDYSIKHYKKSGNGDIIRTGADGFGVGKRVEEGSGSPGARSRNIEVWGDGRTGSARLTGEIKTTSAKKAGGAGAVETKTTPLNRKQAIHSAAKILRSLDNEVTKRKNTADPETDAEIDDILNS